MRKALLLAVSIFALMAITACGAKQNDQLANPWLDHDTLDQACAAAGFDLTVPDHIDGYDAPIYRTLDKEIIEVIYTADNDEICIRKYAGGEDRSSDFGGHESYPHGGYATEVNNCYHEMGTESDVINLVSWSEDDYSFIFFSQNGFTDSDALFDIVHQVK